MEDVLISVDAFHLLSRLFTYPEQLPAHANLVGIATVPWQREADTAALEALQAEYVRLFINALPELPCPPYGSFYIEGTLMGESTVKLRNLHLSYGLQTDEVADHIAVELEFLALLGAVSRETPGVLEDYEFVLNHLRLWTPLFFDRVEENDEIGFYRELSKYARKVLSADNT